jgi:YidC/Oxa1 family membrane protein insertase
MMEFLQSLSNQFLGEPLTYISNLTGNYGYAIIIFTLIIRVLLIPLTLPSLKMQKKMRQLQPELDELKKKHKDDKTALQQAQLALYQKHQVNPAAGCLPMILQFIVLIALYQIFLKQLNGDSQAVTQFLWLNLSKPDPYYIFAVLAGITQFILSLMLLPATSTAAEQTLAQSTPSKKDDKKAEDMTEMAATMQKQMVFMMPIMTVFISLSFPSGLTLYWVVTTLFSIAQQYLVTGWGGLQKYLPFLKSRS